jgi:hypothetical protein
LLVYQEHGMSEMMIREAIVVMNSDEEGKT